MKKSGRKFFIACWGMALLSILLVGSIVLVAVKRDPSSLIGLGTVLALTPAAYMGANAVVKRKTGGE